MEKGSPSPNSADAWDEKFVERSNLVNAFSIPEDAIVEDPPAPLYFRSLRDTADAPRYSLSSSSRSSFSVEGGISDQFGPSSSHSTRASDDSKAENYKLGKQHSRKASAAWNDDLCLENHNPRSGIFWNSTSSLYVKSTMGKPDISRAVRW